MMKPTIARLTAPTLLLFFVVSCYPKTDLGSNDPTEIAKKISEVVDPLARSNNYSGSLLVEKNGNTILARSYGQSNRESPLPNTLKTKFFLASASAMFTSTAVMKLVDSEKLSIDDKLSKFFPDFPNAEKITLHHMLTERTGIPRIGSTGRVNYGKLTETPQKLEDLIDYLKTYKLDYEPGSKYRHTRSSYILLAKIIEKVSGRSFGDFLRDEVFKPLKMYDSGHFEYSDKYSAIPRLARGYSQKGVIDLTLAQQIHWSSKTGHASIYSTVEDLKKFADAALQGKLLSAKSWKRMTSGHDGDNVGYGFFTRARGRHKRFYMSGRSPGFSSYFTVYPDDRLVIIMLSNIDISLPFFTVPKIASILFNEPYTKLKLVTPPDVNRSLAKNYAGSYKFGQDFYRPNGIVRITAKGRRLFADGGPLIPIDDGNGPIRRFKHRRYWSTLEFVSGIDGKIASLKFDSYLGKKN